MAKINENYEAMVIFSTKLEDEGAALIEKFDAMIKDNAESVEMNNWGKRKLAYAINYETEGTYVLWTFTAKPEFPALSSRLSLREFSRSQTALSVSLLQLNNSSKVQQ